MIKIETKGGAIITIDGDKKPKFESKPELEWSPTLLDGKQVNFYEAEEAIAEMGDGWRLPTIRELFSIVDTSNYDPAIDTKKFLYTESLPYWTSTPCVWDYDHYWFVHFREGYVDSKHHTNNHACVRAVREVKHD